MAEPEHTERLGRLNPTTRSGDGSPMLVDTETNAGSGPRADTATDDELAEPGDTATDDELAELAELGLDGRAVFERVRAQLGLGDAGPRTVGRFELLRMLGRGGMGTVFLAHDPKLGREVAIKLVHKRSLASHDKLRARLTREGQALGQLRHPNVVSVHDLGEHDDEVFLAMEYVAGETLRELQDHETVPRDQILRAYIDAGRGLAAAHRADIVHRDFKPENVLVAADGPVQVVDFGLADLVPRTSEPGSAGKGDAADGPDPDERLTQDGEVLGTLGYMSPEQLRGGPATGRSDQFAYCVSVWEALCGQRPFSGSNRSELVTAMIEGHIHGGDRLRRRLRAALVRGMAADPADRHDNMDVLVSMLESDLGRRGRWFRRGSFVLVGVLAGAITAVSLSYVLAGNEAKPCPLSTTIAQVRAQDSWVATRELLDRASARDGLQQLETHLDRLALRADDVCRSGSPLLEQHLAGWVDQLGRLIATAPSRPLDHLLDDIEELGQARFNRRPPHLLSDAVKVALNASIESGRRNELGLALQQATLGYERAAGPVEQAAALLRLGRVRSLSGDYEQALADFEEARVLADRGEHDDARLRANLRAADLAVKRLEDLGKADHYVRNASALLQRLREPILSPRWAEYNELRAEVEKRRLNLDAALMYELGAVMRHAVIGDRRPLARTLLNLGTIYEYRAQPARAESCYRAALERLSEQDPDRYQITLNLGRWLYWNGEDEPAYAEAAKLLRETIEGRDELRVTATTILLLLTIEAEPRDVAAVDELARQLSQLLARAAPATPRHVFEAWRGLTFAYAIGGQFDERFDIAARQVELTAPNQVELAEAELNLADISRDHPQIAMRFATQGIARIERLPATEATDGLLSLARALLAELSAEVIEP